MISWSYCFTNEFIGSRLPLQDNLESVLLGSDIPLIYTSKSISFDAKMSKNRHRKFRA